jgi:outer membrane murein-binding lipoprotein Lpp
MPWTEADTEDEPTSSEHETPKQLATGNTLLDAQVQQLISQVYDLTSETTDLQMQVARANAKPDTWPEDTPPAPFPTNFSVTVSGNQATVVGGYWRVLGGNEGYTGTAPTGNAPLPFVVLTLDTQNDWIFVRNPLSLIGSPQPEIDQTHSPDKPPSNDGTYQYMPLCRCFSADGTSWNIVEVNHPGGDITMAAPLL